MPDHLKCRIGQNIKKTLSNSILKFMKCHCQKREWFEMTMVSYTAETYLSWYFLVCVTGIAFVWSHLCHSSVHTLDAWHLSGRKWLPLSMGVHSRSDWQILCFPPDELWWCTWLALSYTRRRRWLPLVLSELLQLSCSWVSSTREDETKFAQLLLRVFTEVDTCL